MTTDATIHVAALAAANGWRAERYGESVDGVPLMAYWPPQAPTRIVWGAIHGEEWPTLALLHQLLRAMGAASSQAVVVPCANPDGVLAGMRQNARGVDLNRNFPGDNWSAEPSPTFWPTTQTRTTRFRTQRSSPGTAPASEPEVAALIALIERIEPRAAIDVHAPLDLILARSEADRALATQIDPDGTMRVVSELREPTPGDSGTYLEGLGVACVTYEVELGTLPQLWQRHASNLARALTGV